MDILPGCHNPFLQRLHRHGESNKYAASEAAGVMR